MAKSKNGLYAGIAVAVVIIVAVVVGVLVANRKNNAPVEEDLPEAGVVEPITDEAEPKDFSTIDETIAFGDYDGMMLLSKSIQNGEATGKVVKIEGVVSHPMSNYSIVQMTEDGSQSVGTQFVIEGVDEDGYPQDGEKIILTGHVIEKEPMYFVIQTYPELIEVIEEDTAEGSAGVESSDDAEVDASSLEY